MDYNEIKQLAKEQGISVTELCALAPSNDPFYTGRPSELAAARWFGDVWQRFGYGDGVHLRRVHYQLVSQDPPVTHPHRDYADGKPYENTEECWSYLCGAGKWARYLGLVSPSAFVDRRNPDAKVYAHWYEAEKPGYYVNDNIEEFDYYDLPELPELPTLPRALPLTPWFTVYGYGNAQQSYHVEIWCEKTTMNDVLEPLCRRYNVNLVTGAGEMSITSVVDFVRRVRRAGRPARILYVSDFDPAGLGMPISVARKIEFFQREEGYHDLDIRLHPVVLTGEQVAGYQLPRVPVKDSDRRKANWIEAHGAGQVELDALEALHPGELRRILEAAILDYYDPDLQHRTDETRQELADDLDANRDNVMASYQNDLDDLDGEYDALVEQFEETRARFAELVADFQPDIDAHSEKLDDIRERARRVHEGIKGDLKDAGLDADNYPLPDPDLPPESDSKLYDSRRGYLGQLDYYNAYRNGSNGTH